MIAIVAGSRTITDYERVSNAIEKAVTVYGPVSVLISGHASRVRDKELGVWLDNVDRLGERWALQHGIELVVIPAEWDRFGKRAGFLRNEVMAAQALAMSEDRGEQAVLIAVWDGWSRGTRHMMDIALARGLKLHVERHDVQESK